MNPFIYGLILNKGFIIMVLFMGLFFLLSFCTRGRNVWANFEIHEPIVKNQFACSYEPIYLELLLRQVPGCFDSSDEHLISQTAVF